MGVDVNMGSINQDTPPVTGSWTHSFEEDEGVVHVYRPTNSFPFPLSRKGRETIEFDAGGKVNMQEPGPDDRLNIKTYSWRAIDMNRFALRGIGDEHERVIEILDAKPDILKIRNF
jgi:hypothetical protein